MKTSAPVNLDHVGFAVRDFKRLRPFYESALGAIGMTVNMESGQAIGMGANGEKIFWIEKKRNAVGGEHIAFRVRSRASVDRFWEAALAAGGKDHGKPGPRPDYGRNYYAAFVKDAEGNNIEVVCYAPQRRRKH